MALDQFETDVIVIGAGVVGLAIAQALAARGLETVILEKNRGIAEETSSRNSEVVHAGLYYPEHSAKARFCVQGRELLYAWCEARNVPVKRLGKLIVACSEEDEATLERIAAQARRNGAGDLNQLSREEATRLEPALSCRSALWSPHTGVVDSHGFALSLLGAAEQTGAALATSAPVVAAKPLAAGAELTIGGPSPARISAPRIIAAGGLWSGRIADLFDLTWRNRPELVLAKGSYFALQGLRAPFSRLIYPAPVSGGLGVHLTLDLAGAGRFGPDVEFLSHNDPAQIDYAVDPARGDAFYAAIRRYWPTLPDNALAPDYAGVRAKSRLNGQDDFRILGDETHGQAGLWLLHGFESPALTACLAIGAYCAALAA